MSGRCTWVSTIVRTSAGTRSLESGLPSIVTSGRLPKGSVIRTALGQCVGLAARRDEQAGADRDPPRVVDAIGDSDRTPQVRIAVLGVGDRGQRVALVHQ